MSTVDEPTEEPKSYQQREEERRTREEEEENALPWIERIRWRKRHMYKGWATEEILERVGERAAITRSHYHYRVLNTPDMGEWGAPKQALAARVNFSREERANIWRVTAD